MSTTHRFESLSPSFLIALLRILRRPGLLAAAALAAYAVPAKAELLIYTGLAQDYSTYEVPLSKPEHCFVVLDVANLQYTVVYYYKLTGKKKLNYLPVTAMDTTNFSLAAGKMLAGFSSVSHQTIGGGGFADEAFFLSGKVTNLVINSANGHDVAGQGAHTLTGVYRASTLAIGERFEQQTMSLAFDEKRTVQANASLQTIQDVQSDLFGFARSLGYDF